VRIKTNLELISLTDFAVRPKDCSLRTTMHNSISYSIKFGKCRLEGYKAGCKVFQLCAKVW